MENIELHKFMNNENIELRNRLNTLGINDVERIKNLTYKPLDFSEDELDRNFCDIEVGYIEIDKLVGLCRADAQFYNNWLDCLSNLHKMYIFHRYNPTYFDNLLLNPPTNDLPEVLSLNNEYYILGNGKHRLTIAKCVGFKKAKVVIKK